ncbi:hypothetical protein ACFOND_15240 [Reinekea marina]|uniref:Uncharacterized protein n=1 Tax=Reinekea marina TaxID=1310421 RepID=A0ABV7WXC0_9GAMM
MKLIIGCLCLFMSLLCFAETISKIECYRYDCAVAEQSYLSGDVIYSKPNVDALVVGLVELEKSYNVKNVLLKINPGYGRITRKNSEVKGEEVGDNILVLEYLGEGRSSVLLGDSTFQVKVTRRKGDCLEGNVNKRYCWIELHNDPLVEIWHELEDIGWVRISEPSSGNLNWRWSKPH